MLYFPILETELIWNYNVDPGNVEETLAVNVDLNWMKIAKTYLTGPYVRLSAGPKVKYSINQNQQPKIPAIFYSVHTKLSPVLSWLTV